MKHLIIGNSTAAIAAIEGIRAVSRTDDITVVASEAHHSYGRPLISYLLGGKIDESKIYYRKADFYEAHRVRLLLGRTAVKLDAPSK
ncbi:MAG: NAD(P)/FAD-dependent oxidoreductase, partial [Oscillospiraceae bacterium]|nr:NAD(P)/FAD-dependent oxidoreductase [Oscillospiraceae bacterium]